MSGIDMSDHIDAVFQSLHFRREIGWKLRVGTVELAGAMSWMGFSIMFTETKGRSASQYETLAPAHTEREMIAALIRSNLEMNHASSLSAWDELQSQGEAAGSL
jgi:hypothetical protein